MPNLELVAALKQAKSKKMFFAFIPKGSDGKLIVSKNKILAKDLAEAKKEVGGVTPVTGKCFGPSDGMVFQVSKPGAETLAASIKKAVQRDTGFKIVPDVQVAGGADEDEQDAAASPPGAAAAAKPGAPGDAGVMGIQKGLQKLGYDPGKIDGVMGPHTKEAIKKFQQANGLPADGMVGAKTQAALAQALQSGTPAEGGKPPLATKPSGQS